ncbi:MAG: nucleotidyltransferase domain-containing protein [Archaeoglobaceae archaeon]
MERAKIKEITLDVFNKAGVRVEKIVLFGSRARGDFRKDSDWDLLIITEKEIPREEKMKIAHAFRKALAEQRIACDVLIKSKDEVEKRREVVGSVVRTAMREGITL